jgi:hypothetical protein
MGRFPCLRFGRVGKHFSGFVAMPPTRRPPSGRLAMVAVPGASAGLDRTQTEKHP